jgi:hypothetical protein
MSNAPATPWDVYREIHKAMRLALFGVTSAAGATDAADDGSVAALVEEWGRVKFVLDGHHRHEDEFCDVHVLAHAAHLRDELEAGHRVADRGLTALDAAAARLAGAAAADRAALVHGFHLDLADFTAAYLQHLRFEESQVMPALNAAMSDEQLAALTDQIRGSVPPPDMCVFIGYMAPAMNHAERLDMLGGMHRFAPPEIFELFRAAAEAALDPADYRAVAGAAGFA